MFQYHTSHCTILYYFIFTFIKLRICKRISMHATCALSCIILLYSNGHHCPILYHIRKGDNVWYILYTVCSMEFGDLSLHSPWVIIWYQTCIVLSQENLYNEAFINSNVTARQAFRKKVLTKSEMWHTNQDYVELASHF